MRRLSARLVRLTAVVALLSTACVGPGTVTRVIDGRVTEGRYIEAEAYAAFLRGAIAEEARDFRAALAAYEETAKDDPSDPEVWTRIAAVRCAMSPADSGWRWAAARALAIDADYAPAYAARARCELLRGADRVAIERDALRAADDEPGAVESQVVLARVEGGRPHNPDVGRDRLLALTLAHRGSAAAWQALASWASAHGDARTAARAYARLGAIAPGSRAALAAEVARFAGEGEIAAARLLAASLADARTPPPPPLAARLAIDEALLRGDEDAARRRAVSAHIGLDEVAGRALLLDLPASARALASPLAAAEPARASAQIVLALAAVASHEPMEVARILRAIPRVDGELPAAVLLPLLRAITESVSPAAAASVAGALTGEAIVAGDGLVVTVAVDLAARGVLRDDALPLEGQIEVAVRTRRHPSPRGDHADPRHALLALAWESPGAPESRALLRHLAPAVGRDPLVTVAAAWIDLAGGSVDDGAVARLVALGPADALLLSTAADLAEKRGDLPTATQLRARVASLGN